LRRIYFLVLFILLVSISFFIGTKAGDAYPPDTVTEWALSTLLSNNQTDEPQETEPVPEIIEEEPEPEPDIRSLKLVVTGNIMAHIPQIEQAYVEDGKYDFSPSFEIISPYLQAGDFTVGDLEGMQAGPDIISAGWGVRGYTGFPEFNAPGELSEALYDAGINVFTFANNHALDRGLEGLKITLNHVRGLGAHTFGAYKSKEERDTPMILESNGISIAFIGYTYGTNGIPVPPGHEYCVNLAPDFNDITPILDDIQSARQAGADIIAVFPHWGSAEHAHEPQPQRLRQVAEELASAGADLVIGGHPKYIQPAEWFFNEGENGLERATFAIYSQGNFISNQHEAANNTPYVEFGLLLDIDLSKNYDTGDAWISDVDYEITWVHREWRHRVLPLSAVFNAPPEEYNLNENRVERLKNIYRESIDVVNRYGHLEDMKRAMSIAERYLIEAYE